MNFTSLLKMLIELEQAIGVESETAIMIRIQNIETPYWIPRKRGSKSSVRSTEPLPHSKRQRTCFEQKICGAKAPHILPDSLTRKISYS
jgi:hypothetical protein